MPHLDFTFGTGGGSSRRRDPDATIRILVVGDFSGRGSRNDSAALRADALRTVDLDRLDALFAALAPRLQLQPARGHELILALHDREDLHPDRIFDATPAFAELRSLRARLADPRTFAQAAAGLGKPATAADEARPASPERSVAPPSPANDFERLLGGGAGPAAPGAGRSASSPEQQVRSFIEELMAPHIVPDRDPSQPLYLAAVDDTIGALLRTLLHDPRFQALDAAWRGLSQLVEGTAGIDQAEVAVLDASAAEWTDDVLRGDGALATLLASDRGPGDEPWSWVVLAAPVGAEARELEALGALTARAAAGGTAVLAAAHPALLGIRSFAESPDPRAWTGPEGDLASAWSALRSARGASHLALAAPRVLCRLPYGRATDPIERFAFEEFSGPPAHEHYLWGNPGSHSRSLRPWPPRKIGRPRSGRSPSALPESAVSP